MNDENLKTETFASVVAEMRESGYDECMRKCISLSDWAKRLAAAHERELKEARELLRHSELIAREVGTRGAEMHADRIRAYLNREKGR